MVANRLTVCAWLADLSSTLVTDALDSVDIGDRINAAPALDPGGFAAEALDLTRVVAECVATPSDFARLVTPDDADDATRDALVVLTAVARSIAAPRVDWPSRPAARDARDVLSASLDAGLAVASGLGAAGAPLYAWLQALGAVALRVLSDIAANAVPMVRVETGISLPSSVLAYRLYGDAGRAEGLCGVARSLTPMLMPIAFEALER